MEQQHRFDYLLLKEVSLNEKVVADRYDPFGSPEKVENGMNEVLLNVLQIDGV